MNRNRQSRKVLSAIAALVIIGATCLCMAGCGEDKSADADKRIIGTCTVTVEGNIESQEYDIAQGDTVYDILKKTDLNISAKDSGQGMEIEAIAGRANGEGNNSSGWLYTVNGEMPMEYCSNIEVKDGDEIIWSFAKGM